jgi:hypothetical protein
MPPFRSLAHALRPLALLGRRGREGSAPRAVGREIELYRGPAGPNEAADAFIEAPGPEQRRAAGAGRGLFGLGAGRLLVAAVLSFGVVLGGATVMSVLRGGPMTRSSSADQPAGQAPEARAGPGPNGTATGGSGPDAAAPLIGANGGAGAAQGGSDISAAAARAELPGRLQEILQVREEAFARRDAGLLASVYTADCACLRSGRAAIAQLRADHAVWRGRSVSVRVEHLSRVNDSLWIALALLRRSAFRIEAEDGELISAEPAVQQRYRFALARGPAGTWLLGHASLVEELPP